MEPAGALGAQLPLEELVGVLVSYVLPWTGIGIVVIGILISLGMFEAESGEVLREEDDVDVKIAGLENKLKALDDEWITIHTGVDGHGETDDRTISRETRAVPGQEEAAGQGECGAGPEAQRDAGLPGD
jgi:hypothetical protein